MCSGADYRRVSQRKARHRPARLQNRAQLFGQGLTLPSPNQLRPLLKLEGYAVASPNEKDITKQEILKAEGRV